DARAPRASRATRGVTASSASGSRPPRRACARAYSPTYPSRLEEGCCRSSSTTTHTRWRFKVRRGKTEGLAEDKKKAPRWVRVRQGQKGCRLWRINHSAKADIFFCHLYPLAKASGNLHS